MNRHEKFSHLTEEFDIPFSRRDTSKRSNVAWLIRNIRANNSNCPKIDEAMGVLLMINRDFKFRSEKE